MQVEVHQKFRCVPETLYLTINLIDRYLELEQVERSKLQLVGVTALLVNECILPILLVLLQSEPELNLSNMIDVYCPCLRTTARREVRRDLPSGAA